MQINFFDDPAQTPKSREDVRLNELGLYVYPDGRRVAVGFHLTPFLEKPCIEVRVVNERGETAGWLNVIETADANFSLTMHLRDKKPTTYYEVTATVYYAAPDTDRIDVHTLTRSFDGTREGEQ
ncbi:MAG: hypothetical protein IPM39_23130 [Chloroflexi bacterium]|nr:hypothetical protein [Chloroflexota bacterium]